MDGKRDLVAVAQGAYYVATGLWSILHLRSFERVSGPKVDDWLVKTVGALAAVIGGTLMTAGWRKRVAPETALLGVGSAIAFGFVDTWYAGRGRISPIYLADALVEVVFVGGWARRGISVRA